MIENVEISKATFGDLADILKLQEAFFISEAELYNDFSIAPLTQTLDSIEEDFKNYLFLKAEYKNEIVGCVRARETGEFCWIIRMIVASEFQNRGIGRNLMNAIEGAFPKTKLYLLSVDCRSIKNIKLYESMGYIKKELVSDEQSRDLILVKIIKRIGNLDNS